MSKYRLIIFVKAPRPGFVKTRLAEKMGVQEACGAYQRLVKTLLCSLETFTDVELRFTPDEAGAEIGPWLRPGWRARPQGTGTLGKRLAGAFAEAFEARAERVVVIGSDCPYVTVEDIERAWAQLRLWDVVLGPAEDGGYWLVGLRQGQPELFEGVPWSSEGVLKETLARAQKLGLKTELLRSLSDVDEEEDWKRFISAARQEP